MPLIPKILELSVVVVVLDKCVLCEYRKTLICQWCSTAKEPWRLPFSNFNIICGINYTIRPYSKWLPKNAISNMLRRSRWNWHHKSKFANTRTREEWKEGGNSLFILWGGFCVPTRVEVVVVYWLAVSQKLLAGMRLLSVEKKISEREAT